MTDDGSAFGLEEVSRAVTAGAAADEKSVTRVTPSEGQLIFDLSLASIRPNPRQPRRTFDQAALQELATSIAARGRVVQPIVVRRIQGANGDRCRFELVAGERRWRASALAGLPTIRAIVEGVDDVTSAEMALTENMAREDLNAVDEARGCAALRDEFGLSVAEIARCVGRSRTAISHRIRLLELPDSVLEQVAAGVLSEGHGRVLLRLPDHGDRVDLGRRCVRAGWSVRELERQVDARLAPAVGSRPPPDVDEAAMLEALEEALTPLFGPSPLRIVSRERGGYELQVGFHDLRALTVAIERLAAPPG